MSAPSDDDRIDAYLWDPAAPPADDVRSVESALAQYVASSLRPNPCRGALKAMPSFASEAVSASSVAVSGGRAAASAAN